MGGCETRGLSTKEQYYFNKIDSFATDPNLKTTVKLEAKLKNVSSSNACTVQLVIYTDTLKQSSKTGGTTEEACPNTDTKTISYSKFFVMEYFFEREQPISFRITGTVNGKIDTTLATIMGSRGQTLNREIEGSNGVILEIKGFSYKSKVTATLNFIVSVSGQRLPKTGVNYVIKAKGTNANPLNNILFKSEIIRPVKNTNEINFKSSNIPDIHIAPDGDYNTNFLSIELIDLSHNKKMGEYSGPLNNLINKETPIQITNGTGKIRVEQIKNYSFIEYLRGGMQINFSVAIDFTGSNGSPNLPNSLHYLGPVENSYERAIKSCGNIVAYYDYDQKFPAFGFGGKFYGNQQVDHCFPLNGNPNDPEIYGIDGILQAYRTTLSNCQLYGPTYFHHFIDVLNRMVKEQVQGENFVNYHVLMILTDGIIDDMDETINSLVEASYLPISIIIVGIGAADFTNMDVLDADDQPLYDVNGRKADRDLVQFVPFRNFQNDGAKLAEQVLEEVPRQIVEFYQHRRIPPGEPVINI